LNIFINISHSEVEAKKLSHYLHGRQLPVQEKTIDNLVLNAYEEIIKNFKAKLQKQSAEKGSLPDREIEELLEKRQEKFMSSVD